MTANYGNSGVRHVRSTRLTTLVYLFSLIVTFGVMVRSFRAGLPIYREFYYPHRILGTGTTIGQTIWIFLYASVFLLLANYWRRTLTVRRKLLRTVLVSVALCVLVLLSTLWSVEPKVTLRLGVALVLGMVTAYFFASYYSIMQFVRVLSYTCTILLITSIFVIVLFPHVGIHTGVSHNGLWRGIFMSKNFFGSFLAIASIFYLFFPKKSRIDWIICIGGFVTALLIHFWFPVGSRSSQLGLLLSVGLLPLLSLYYLPRRIAGILGSVVLFVGGVGSALILSNWTAVMGILGKSATMSGRLETWSRLWEAIKQRPWLGYGYEGFWSNSFLSEKFIYQYDLSPSNAHNSFLELMLELGPLGLVFLIVLIVIYFFNARHFLPNRFREFRSFVTWFQPRIIPFVMGIYMVLTGLQGSDFFRPNHFHTVLFFTFLFMSAKQASSSSDPELT